MKELNHKTVDDIEKHSEEIVHMILMTEAKQLDKNIKSRCFGIGNSECSNCRHCIYQDKSLLTTEYGVKIVLIELGKLFEKEKSRAI